MANPDLMSLESATQGDHSVLGAPESAVNSEHSQSIKGNKCVRERIFTHKGTSKDDTGHTDTHEDRLPMDDGVKLYPVTQHSNESFSVTLKKKSGGGGAERQHGGKALA